MPKAKRERRERTDNYALILQWCRTPEQRLYEGIRPIALFGVPQQNGRRKPVWLKVPCVELPTPLIRKA
ncbi:MAG: hypothetical protein NVSMB27_47720 [Ktedonobacteraceae bacterium]